jgi:hypothetical protein
MADYSGAWDCSECGAGGYNYSGDHKSWCSVNERLRKMHLEREAEEEAERQMKAAWREAFSAMPDEELVETVRDFGKLVKERQAEARQMHEEWVIGLRVVQARRLGW